MRRGIINATLATLVGIGALSTAYERFKEPIRDFTNTFTGGIERIVNREEPSSEGIVCNSGITNKIEYHDGLNMYVPAYEEPAIRRNINNYLRRGDFLDFLKLSEELEVAYAQRVNQEELSSQDREDLMYLAMAITFVESGGNPSAVSKSNAKTNMGLMDFNLTKNNVNPRFVHNPVVGINGGITHLTKRLKENDNSTYFAINAYSSGEYGIPRRIEEQGLNKRTELNTEQQLIRFHNSLNTKENRDYYAKIIAAYRVIKNPENYNLPPRNPHPNEIYIVQPADTITGITRNMGLPLSRVAKVKKINNIHKEIHPGEPLVYPTE